MYSPGEIRHDSLNHFGFSSYFPLSFMRVQYDVFSIVYDTHSLYPSSLLRLHELRNWKELKKMHLCVSASMNVCEFVCVCVCIYLCVCLCGG